jgi:hypothetical protein
MANKEATIPGYEFFGDGSDGNITLVADTARASGSQQIQALTLACAGFKLTQNTADFFLLVSAQISIALGSGGKIFGDGLTAAPVDTNNGSASQGGAPNGVGGSATAVVNGCWVYAPNITGTGNIGTPAYQGGTGHNGGTATGNANGLTGTIGLQGNKRCSDLTGYGTAAQTGVGGTNPTGGAGGTLTVSTQWTTFWPIVVLLYRGAWGPSSADPMLANSILDWRSGGGAQGGGSGASLAAHTSGFGGGGGGGGHSPVAAGSPGGAGGAPSAVNGTGSGGGGGGGGSGGGWCGFAVHWAASTVTFTTVGGAGGNGGVRNHTSGGEQGGGGGGGGGAGGATAGYGNTGGGYTVTAAGGAKGLGDTNGNPGSDGTPGNDGKAANMTYDRI